MATAQNLRATHGVRDGVWLIFPWLPLYSFLI
jgi:hypothetical protein